MRFLLSSFLEKSFDSLGIFDIAEAMMIFEATQRGCLGNSFNCLTKSDNEHKSVGYLRYVVVNTHGVKYSFLAHIAKKAENA